MSSKSRKQVSVTQHRLFPVIVGLWFAALLGLGSFAVPPELLSRAVTATRLPEIVPATAPPLGFTARALVALVLTGLGGLLGFFIARRFRATAAEPARRRSVTPVDDAAPRVRARDSHPDAPPRKPFTASEDMGSADAEAPDRTSDLPLRRRALAMTDESVLPPPADLAPLPGMPAVEPLDLDLLFSDVAEPAMTPEAQPAELSLTEEVAEFATESEPVETQPPAAVAEAPAWQASPVAENAAEDVEVDGAKADAEAGAPRSPIADAPLESLGVVQLVERLAVAIADYNERRPDRELPQLLAATFAGSRLAPSGGVPQQVAPVLPHAVLPHAVPATAVPPRPVVRLHTAAFPPPAVAVPDLNPEQAPLPVQTARFLGMDTAVAADDVADEAVPEDDYSSLLDLKAVARPTVISDAPLPPVSTAPLEVSSRQVFIRVDLPAERRSATEPVVVFPGQEGPAQVAALGAAALESATVVSAPTEPAMAPDEADRALRAALATLQRMSGSR